MLIWALVGGASHMIENRTFRNTTYNKTCTDLEAADFEIILSMSCTKFMNGPGGWTFIDGPGLFMGGGG